jgi:hypothetical protein
MDEIFKVFEVVMNLTAAKSQTVSKQVMTTARRLVIFVLIALGCMILFCVGISIAATNLAIQLDNPILVGSVLAVLSLSIFFICLSQKIWVKAAAIKPENKNSAPSPVEDALALLIKDIVQERQAIRNTPPSTEGQNL